MEKVIERTNFHLDDVELPEECDSGDSVALVSLAGLLGPEDTFDGLIVDHCLALDLFLLWWRENLQQTSVSLFNAFINDD